MRKFNCSAAIFILGCGGAAAGAPATTSQAYNDPPAIAQTTAPAPEAQTAAIDVRELPAAPWSEAPLASGEVPAQLVTAWQRADNRDWCAPLAPRGFGRGAHARTTQVEGGWAIEFDQPGARGLGSDGTGCDNCGRGVFGIVGTSMTREEFVDPENDQAFATPTFADGSHSEIEASDGVAAATITVAGQGCVYQVWSFLGEQHVQELVGQLRLVDMSHTHTDTSVARVSNRR